MYQRGVLVQIRQPRASQNSNSFAKIQPTNCALIHISAHYLCVEFQHDYSWQSKISIQSPSQKFYLVWCQSQFRILFCHAFSRENLNAFFPPRTKAPLFPEHSFLSEAPGAARTCSVFQRADGEPRGEGPCATEHVGHKTSSGQLHKACDHWRPLQQEIRPPAAPLRHAGQLSILQNKYTTARNRQLCRLKTAPGTLLCTAR